MSDKLKTAFDSIRAEESLKSNTIEFLQKEIRKKQVVKRRHSRMKIAGAFVAMVLVFFSGAFSYSLYFSSEAYVDVDINPSIEFVVNRFDRIIDTRAYNGDGDDIISKLDLKHKNYKDALLILMDTINKKGYIQNNGLISVTLQTNDADRENQMLTDIQVGVEGFMQVHHSTAQVDIFPVSDVTRTYAYELEVSPAKYIAIQELIEIDPYATVEGCKGHSVGELKQLTRDHKNKNYDHNNAQSIDSQAGNGSDAGNESNAGNGGQNSQNNQKNENDGNHGHHGGGHNGGNGYHGGE